MRLVVAILLALHGLAHLVGFRDAFWPSPITRRRTSYFGRRIEGAAWLLITVGFLVTAALLFTQNQAWTPLLVLSAGASLGMCLLAWPKAKIGVLIDVALLVLTLLLSPHGGPYLMAMFE